MENSMTAKHHRNPLSWRSITARALFTVSLIAFLAGCAVGPNYTRPTTPLGKRYTPMNVENAASNKDNKDKESLYTWTSDVPGSWWSLYRSPELDALVRRAVRHNPDIAAAQASLIKAEETANASFSGFFPSLEGNFSSTRQKSTTGSIYTLHNASVGVTYAFDLFGLTRRSVEAAEANTDYARYLLEGSWLTVTGNVVTAALQEASLRAQIKATELLVKSAEARLDLVEQQATAGLVNQTLVLEAQQTLESRRAALAPLTANLAASQSQQAVLIGSAPNTVPTSPFDLMRFALPQKLPLSLPVRLLDQRPDILAAEAQMRAASANIGVAAAKRLPGLNLSASIGSNAAEIGNLFTPGGGIWNFGATLTQTIFDAGSLASQQSSAEAEFDRTKAVYRKTVLTALKEVADILNNLHSDARVLASAQTAASAAEKNLALVNQQFTAGAVDKLTVLTAEDAVHNAHITLAKAKVSQLSDAASLLQAMGGGWWHKKNTTK